MQISSAYSDPCSSTCIAKDSSTFRSGHTRADGRRDGLADLAARGHEERAAATRRRLQAGAAQAGRAGEDCYIISFESDMLNNIIIIFFLPFLFFNTSSSSTLL